MSKENVTVEAVCYNCKGTGLYQGMAEKGGAFVECHSCKGTGCSTVTYTPFEKRAKETKCKRVYLSGGGYVITDKDIEVDGKPFPFSKYGCTYEEWVNGKRPEQLKFLGCPMLLDQGGCHKIKDFIPECEKINGGYINYDHIM